MYDMGAHGQKAYPLESCGIITKDYKYIQCENVSSEPKNSFILDPLALYEHEDNIWGIVHSHPGDENPIPSDEDAPSTVFDEFKFLVGFGTKYFIYWRHKKINTLIYEPFEEKHLDENYPFS